MVLCNCRYRLQEFMQVIHDEEVKSMAAILEVKNLSKVFTSQDGKVHALTDINLSISEGSIYGIIGMSGAGKSTLVRCFNYLEVPTEGDVYVDGRRLGDLTQRKLLELRTEIGMIFQSFNLLMQKNVLDNVILPLRIKGVEKEAAKTRAQKLLAEVGLSDKEKAYPSQLSGGQMQRVAIARALANNPRILLCDEATSALDPDTTKSILKLIKELNKKYGITVIIITHSMSVVKEVCNRVAVIEKGRLIRSGKTKEVMAYVDANRS